MCLFPENVNFWRCFLKDQKLQCSSTDTLLNFWLYRSVICADFKETELVTILSILSQILNEVYCIIINEVLEIVGALLLGLG